MKKTTTSRLLCTAALAALALPASMAAQEETTHEEHQEVTVQLAALGAANVSGDIALRNTGDERQEMSTEPQPVELTFNVQGLEPNQDVRLLVHQGPCSTGMTTVAEIGSYTADEQGALTQTETVTSEDLWHALRESGTMTEEVESDQAYHLQLEAMGQPLACGNFGSM